MFLSEVCFWLYKGFGKGCKSCDVLDKFLICWQYLCTCGCIACRAEYSTAYNLSFIKY